MSLLVMIGARRRHQGTGDSCRWVPRVQRVVSRPPAVVPQRRGMTAPVLAVGDGALGILRQRVTKGPGSRAAGVAMAFKLIESAQTRWRAVDAPHLVALVRAGAPGSRRETHRTTRRIFS